MLKLIEEGDVRAASAVGAMVRLGDTRAIAPLVRYLLSEDPRGFHIANIAGRLIADFQGAGYVALEPLTIHPDKEIRRRALIGIGDLALAKERSVKIKARELLRRLITIEPDAELRRTIGIFVDVAGNKR